MAVKPAKKPGKGKAPAKRPPGRPSKYTPKLVEDICARLAQGEAMAVICRDKGMPDPSTVWDWQQADPKVSQAIARAREEGYDAIALEALDIADDGSRDYKPDKDGRDVVDHDHIARSRLRVDTRLKLLSKWDPKRYGDKIQHADADGEKLPPPVVTVNFVRPG